MTNIFKRRIFALFVIVLLNFSDFRICYAPFEFAPQNMEQFIAQGMVLCVMHLICVFSVKAATWPNIFTLLICFLSVNSSLWACARVIAFTEAAGEHYLEAYKSIFLMPLAITGVIEILHLNYAIKQKERIDRGPVLVHIISLCVGVAVFTIIAFLPIYKEVTGSRLWQVAYVYHVINAIIIVFILILGVRSIYKWGKNHRVIVLRRDT